MAVNVGERGGASRQVKQLALEIASCSDVDSAVGGGHPCSPVIRWQLEEFVKRGHGERDARLRMHRPEPWAGGLETAKIVWISSNPGFSLDERFPTWDSGWDGSSQDGLENVAEFMANRFSDDDSRGFGAGDLPHVNWDKTIGHDGDFSSSRVKTWSSIRRRSAHILGQRPEETLASRDFVMTEVVHCKSKSDNLLTKECVSHCAQRWLPQILSVNHCQAGLVIVSGRPAADIIREMFDLPEYWGPSERESALDTYWPKTGKDLARRSEAGTWTIREQQMHSADVPDFYGRARTVVWFPHPTARVTPRRVDDPKLIDQRLVERWRIAALA